MCLRLGPQHEATTGGEHQGVFPHRGVSRAVRPRETSTPGREHRGAFTHGTHSDGPPRQVQFRSALRRTLRLDFSIVSQIDGLLYAMLGLRVERDVFASCLDESCCDFFGRQMFESCASFTGIYLQNFVPESLGATLSMIKAHRAIGVVVVPVWPNYDWYKEYEKVSMLQFHLPKDVLLCATTGKVVVMNHGLVALVPNFQWIGRLKSKRRPEKVFKLRTIPALRVPPLRVDTVPKILTRPSPMAEEMRPAMEDDVINDAGPFRSADSPSAPGQAKSMWNAATVARWTEDYPFEEVAEIARQGVAQGVDPFMGRLDKSVVHKSAKQLRPDVALTCRTKMMEDCAAGLTYGPFKDCPWRYARITPIFSVPKHKHTDSEEIRLISHFSKGLRGLPGSINALCYSPELIAFHCRPLHIKDRIARCGIGAMVYAVDVPKCFRRQRILAKLLRLFVYQIITAAFGKEFFVDASNPFGWKVSNWVWDCILAVLMWRLLTYCSKHRVDPKCVAVDWGEGLSFDKVMSYVDNFFDINRKMPQLQFDERCSVIDGVFEAAGLVMHERQTGTHFKGLGWLWDTVSMTMQCPEDKYIIVSKYVAEWCEVSTLSCEDWHKAVGILYWLTAGFRICRASVGVLVHDRTRAEALSVRLGVPRHKAMMAKSKVSTSVFKMIKALLAGWNRLCPIVEGFTPTASWQYLGRVDASTEWGCGGVLLDAKMSSLLGGNHAWSSAERAASFVVSRESTGVLEAMGALWWLEHFSSNCRGCRVLLELDNSATVLGLQGLYSATPSLMEVIEKIAMLCCRLHIELRVRHVHGEVFNRVADALSHDLIDRACAWAKADFALALSIL